MSGEVHGPAEYYATPAGAAAARILARRLRALWPALPGMAVLGIGHAVPYLGLWRAEAARCIALSPPQLGPAVPGQGATLMAEEDALPFPDLSFDRILVVHGLETAENTRRLLREVWRVLKDDGRVLVDIRPPPPSGQYRKVGPDHRRREAPGRRHRARGPGDLPGHPVAARRAPAGVAPAPVVN